MSVDEFVFVVGEWCKFVDIVCLVCFLLFFFFVDFDWYYLGWLLNSFVDFDIEWFIYIDVWMVFVFGCFVFI